MTRRTRAIARGLTNPLALAVATASVLLMPSTAHAVSTDVVISEVYGGGGNTGATYTNDFVELRNAGPTAVDVTGWSIQYAAATGTTWSNKTTLTGSIAAGSSYLIKLASGGSTGAALPAADVTGTTNMSATAGKVALVTNDTALTCGSNCDWATGVKDFVGYGSANDYEGTPAPAGSNTKSPQRGTTDTDDNGADFVAASPTPAGSGGGGGGSSCPGVRIHDVQRASHVGATGSVAGLPGVITAKTSTGFYMQDTDDCVDGDVATSEGIFVNGRTSNAVGTSVTVSGTVAEVRPGGVSDNLSTTQVNSPSVKKVATGQPLPPATQVGSGGRVPPASVIEDDATGNVETSGTFDPATDGIDFWESMEGMRVTLMAPQVVGPTNQYGETPVVPNGSGLRTPRGGIVVSATDFNPERVILGTELGTGVNADTGDTFTGDVTGVLDYDFANFMLQPTSQPTVQSGGLAAEATTAQGAGQLATATFNVENLDPTDPQSKFDGLARQVVDNLRSPDLIALEEVQDNNGATDNGVVAADQTLSKLVAAIAAAGGPSYTWREIDPQNDQDGGEPGGNIRCVFLFRTDRGLAFVDRGTPTATTDATLTGTGTNTHLTVSPSRISPTSSSWSATRKPLVGEFTWNGQTLFAVANHFSSKGGDDPLFGKVQPPVASSEPKRHQQAQLVRDFLSQVLAADGNAKVVVMGDLNDFEFSQTADILVGSGATAFTDLPRTLPAAERYTYVYEGNSQVLDHILLSPALTGYQYDVVHANAEFRLQQSDHDPSVARLTF